MRTILKDIDVPWGVSPLTPMMVRPKVIKRYIPGNECPITQVVLQPVEVEIIEDFSDTRIDMSYNELEITAKQYAEKHTMYFPDITLLRVGQKEAFEAGAIWSQNEVWHSAEEEPRLNEELLLITRTADKCLTGRYVGDGYYHLHGFVGEYTEIDKWAYINEIIPAN